MAGGEIARWISEVKDKDDAACGYVLGSQLLDFLTPDGQETYTVPVTTEKKKRVVQDGAWNRDDIAQQTKMALNILNKESDSPRGKVKHMIDLML